MPGTHFTSRYHDDFLKRNPAKKFGKVVLNFEIGRNFPVQTTHEPRLMRILMVPWLGYRIIEDTMKNQKSEQLINKTCRRKIISFFINKKNNKNNKKLE